MHFLEDPGPIQLTLRPHLHNRLGKHRRFVVVSINSEELARLPAVCCAAPTELVAIIVVTFQQLELHDLLELASCEDPV